MTTDDLPSITRLYQACEPLQALHPDDPRWVVVFCDRMPVRCRYLKRHKRGRCSPIST